MHELLRLLREFAAGDDVDAGAYDDLIALAEGFLADDADRTAMADDDLDTLLEGLVALADHDEASAALLSEAVGVATEVRAETTRREEQAEADEAERAAAIAALRGENTDDTPGDEDGDGDGEGDDTAGTDTVDDTATDESAGQDEGADEGAEDRTPVAAAGGNRAARRALARRRPRRAETPEVLDTRPVIHFAADVPNVTPGSTTRDLEDVSRALVRRQRSFSRAARSSVRGRERIPVATIVREFPEERRLVDERGRMLAPHIAAERVQRVIDEAIGRFRTDGRQALTAAGGLCAPPQAIYTVPVLGEQMRPIRDTAMVSFQGARGAQVSVAPPVLGSVADAVSVWTVADDEAALESDSVVKPCLRIECDEDRTSEIEAIVKCLTVGNFTARTFGEWTDAWSELAMVVYDRVAELQLFNAIAAASDTMNLETTTVSATRDVLDLLSRLAWGIRTRNRLGRNFPFRVILPDVLHGVIRTDIARALPGGSFVENLAVADATIARFFAEQSLNVTWSPDLALMGAQAAATVVEPWPDEVPYALYPEGTWLHVDAGELDLGVVRDSALNSVNDLQLFSEGFEAAHYLGSNSYNGTIEVCPSGTTSGTADLTGICGS